jgi:hypothetical protein
VRRLVRSANVLLIGLSFPACLLRRLRHEIPMDCCSSQEGLLSQKSYADHTEPYIGRGLSFARPAA